MTTVQTVQTGAPMTPHAFAKDFIFCWEDGKQTDPVKTHSMDRDDSGNWTTGVIGQGALVGSQHGVMPAVLALWREVPVSAIAVSIMRALTLDEAADIALARFYKELNLDRLRWNAVTAPSRCGLIGILRISASRSVTIDNAPCDPVPTTEARP